MAVGGRSSAFTALHSQVIHGRSGGGRRGAQFMMWLVVHIAGEWIGALCIFVPKKILLWSVLGRACSRSRCDRWLIGLVIGFGYLIAERHG